MMELKKGDKVRITGAKGIQRQGFIEIVCVVEEGCCGNGHSGDVLLRPETERPDGFGLSSFCSHHVDMELIEEEKVVKFEVGDVVEITSAFDDMWLGFHLMVDRTYLRAVNVHTQPMVDRPDKDKQHVRGASPRTGVDWDVKNLKLVRKKGEFKDGDVVKIVGYPDVNGRRYITEFFGLECIFGNEYEIEHLYPLSDRPDGGERMHFTRSNWKLELVKTAEMVAWEAKVVEEGKKMVIAVDKQLASALSNIEILARRLESATDAKEELGAANYSQARKIWDLESRRDDLIRQNDLLSARVEELEVETETLVQYAEAMNEGVAVLNNALEQYGPANND